MKWPTKRMLMYATVLLTCLFGIAFLNWWGKPDSECVPQENLPVRVVYIGGRDVRAMIADTPALREEGLSGHAALAPDEGMLFVFPTDGQYGFWMKDMRFPIDILWLSGRGEILDMRESVSPATYPAVFTPKAPARYVLELPAGFSEAYTVKIGDEVKL